MKVSCLQENLARGLSIVGRSVAGRTTLPVLSNVLLSAEDDRLKLTANNLEIGINCWVGAKVEEPGEITIPARLLTDFVNSLPPERIDLILDEETNTVNARCANFEANLKGISAQEFPRVPGLEAGGEIIHLNPHALKKMIQQVAFAAAADESRPILTGILAKIGPDELSLAAADGFRLSTTATPLPHPLDQPLEVVIPARALSELAKIIGDQDEPIQMAITPNSNQILFHMDDIDLVSQLIDGKFPDVQQIIPESHATRTTIDTNNLLKAVRVAYLFARDAANIVKLEAEPGESDLHPGRVVLTATSQELGGNVSGLDANVNGGPIEIAFNAKYLIDVLGVLDSPQVVLETTASASPGVLRSVGDDNFIHVIMPMHISR